MKTFAFVLMSFFTFSLPAAEVTSQMVVEELLNSSGEKVSVVSCVCYRGPGQGQPYYCRPVQQTCYGGPGNYPYPCTVCPSTGR